MVTNRWPYFYGQIYSSFYNIFKGVYVEPLPNQLSAHIAMREAQHQRQAEAEHERAEFRREQARLDDEATVEARRLGAQYVNLLRGRNVATLPIFDNLPKYEQTFLPGIGARASANHITAPSYESMVAMTTRTGEGWIVGFGGEYCSIEGGLFQRQYGLDTDGALLQSFHRYGYPVRFEDHEVRPGTGIVKPHRAVGRAALRDINSNMFLDGIVRLLDGKEPERKDYYS